MSTVKEAARAIVDKLPEDATWDDLMYEFYVKQKIEAGLTAADEGRTTPHSEIRSRLIGDRSYDTR
jgi:predicted transcriptional regulator